jgi:phosphoribosyl-AMP cyclohydrolase
LGAADTFRFLSPNFVLGFPTMSFYDKLKFDANGLIPAIIQEHKTGRVMMFAWMNRASLEKTVATGKTHFWSRSRQKFWMKGEESGHTQTVKDIAFDCDGDVLLIQVEQIGAACHEGYQSCFFRSEGQGRNRFKITEPQLQKPEEIYKKKDVFANADEFLKLAAQGN